MKLINAQFFIKEEKREIFLSDINELIAETRKEAGCVEYNLYESIEERNTFIMVEVWENQDAIEVHNQSPLLQKLFNNVADFSAKAPVLRVSELGE
ncbi:putative quinol monooxygenase [Marinilactibacillus kalidii]|uniref:putative quinol monooxygenase n=1 Tax=Marinilactibacillus kalidii TaxID=2820274 RepID=UPI001ABDD85F|nr:putative quinol monooxygenase [Marinilactibacillus kalidii]